MSEEKKRLMVFVGVMFIILVLLFMWVFVGERYDKIVEPVKTPDVTLASTETVSPSATPDVTRLPATIVIVTAEPTITPTPEPTATPTAEPTATPTVEPTATPTATPTVVPTATPTAEPTATPDSSQKVEQIKKEFSKLTQMGGIYIDYSVKAKHDLYETFDIEGVDSKTLFEELRKPFENGIAGWTKMSFEESNSSIEMLSKALDSSICPLCDRVYIAESQENSKQISSLFDRIGQEGELETVNKLLLNYLYEYTALNSQNLSERLILACNCE